MMLMSRIRMPGDGVAADELAGAVHGAVEVRFGADLERGAVRASSWVIRPALRSASIAICLPGMASKVKRALTSEMRPEPLVTTTKLMMVRMMNTTTPTAKLPPTTNSPNDWMTWPAACGPL